MVFDESTDCSTQKMLIVILILLSPKGEVTYEYLAMPSIEKGNAETIHKEIEKLLSDFGAACEKVRHQSVCQAESIQLS